MENKIPAVRCAGALFAFPDNCGAPYCEGQALKVKVQPSIEPSDGRVVNPLSQPEPSTDKVIAVV